MAKFPRCADRQIRQTKDMVYFCSPNTEMCDASHAGKYMITYLNSDKNTQ